MEVLRPRKLKEALAMLAEAAEAGAPLKPLAGGTDLFVTLTRAVGRERRFLDVWNLDELRHLDDDGRALTFGALTTYTIASVRARCARSCPSRGGGGRGGRRADPEPRHPRRQRGQRLAAGDALPVLAGGDA